MIPSGSTYTTVGPYIKGFVLRSVFCSFLFFTTQRWMHGVRAENKGGEPMETNGTYREELDASASVVKFFEYIPKVPTVVVIAIVHVFWNTFLYFLLSCSFTSWRLDLWAVILKSIVWHTLSTSIPFLCFTVPFISLRSSASFCAKPN